jgi:hypothetical protein
MAKSWLKNNQWIILQCCSWSGDGKFCYFTACTITPAVPNKITADFSPQVHGIFYCHHVKGFDFYDKQSLDNDSVEAQKITHLTIDCYSKSDWSDKVSEAINTTNIRFTFSDPLKKFPVLAGFKNLNELSIESDIAELV